MRTALVVLQYATFAALGVLFIHEGNPRLGVAQLLLGAVTVLVYI